MVFSENMLYSYFTSPFFTEWILHMHSLTIIRALVSILLEIFFRRPMNMN